MAIYSQFIGWPSPYHNESIKYTKMHFLVDNVDILSMIKEGGGLKHFATGFCLQTLGENGCHVLGPAHWNHFIKRFW